MSAIVEWALLAYRLPREPSTPRITLWRQLRRLGAIQVVDGLVALPSTERNREQFEWLAEGVCEAGGEAWTWSGRSGTIDQDQALNDRLHQEVAAEYVGLLAQVAEASEGRVTQRTVERLRRELRRVEARDHVRPPEREQARAALDGLGSGRATPRERSSP